MRYLAPRGGLLVGCESVGVAQNVHAMLGSGQHDVDTIGYLQKADCTISAATLHCDC